MNPEVNPVSIPTRVPVPVPLPIAHANPLRSFAARVADAYSPGECARANVAPSVATVAHAYRALCAHHNREVSL